MEDHVGQKPTMIQRAYTTSCDLISETAEYLASFSLGQSILRQTDRALWTIEKCAEWSVPSPSQPQAKQHHNSQNGTFGKSGPLVRPLPWLLFLPMLFILRCLRISLTIAALLLGFESVKPITMVRFIQVRRRRVRALKFLGLRRIRQRKLNKENALKNTMTIRERFYNIMSRAMCFRVTNSDMHEEITVRKTEEEPQSSSSNTNTNTNRQRSITGKDLKRKYIEILKNNYYDWEDIEDDEELIDRITQLAEDDLEDEDPDFLPAEDSATEEDSMSDAEDDTLISAVTPPPKQLQRLSSHSSLANEIITEENEEDSESTVSANSDDESSQHIEKEETPKKPDPNLSKDETPKKPDPNLSKDEKNNLEPAITSDEYYSPMNSICASPEPKIDTEMSKCNKESENKSEIKIDEKNESINSENKVTVNTKNNQNSLPATTPMANNGAVGKANANSHSFSPKMKKHKHRRRFSNLLRRKRK